MKGKDNGKERKGNERTMKGKEKEITKRTSQGLFYLRSGVIEGLGCSWGVVFVG